ncbi:hypothetical protein V3595_11225 [Bacillus sp. CFBP9009]
MKPYNSFDQQNHNNGTENIYQNAHLRNMDNDFLAVPYENQIMDVRTPPGPPGRPTGTSRRRGRRTEEARLI